MKKTLIYIAFILLLVFIVKAQNLPVGSDCLNNNECLSGVCQGGECRSDNILTLINDTMQEIEESASQDGDVGAGVCIENWQCGSWTACVSNSQTRTCTDLNDCDNAVILNSKPPETQSCTPALQATCTDGIKNQGEEAVDCGGPCPACKTCYDLEQNCHSGSCETGIDCGGSCMPCEVQEAGSSKAFWISFISILLVLIIVIVGILYWRLKGEAKEVGKEEKKWEHKKPPIQPSSLLRI